MENDQKIVISYIAKVSYIERSSTNTTSQWISSGTKPPEKKMFNLQDKTGTEKLYINSSVQLGVHRSCRRN